MPIFARIIAQPGEVKLLQNISASYKVIEMVKQLRKNRMIGQQKTRRFTAKAAQSFTPDRAREIDARDLRKLTEIREAAKRCRDQALRVEKFVTRNRIVIHQIRRCRLAICE